MQVQEDKKIKKQLKKIQPQVVKKYNKLIKDLKASGLNANYDFDKLLHDKSFYRIKLDYRHRVAIQVKAGKLTITKVATRENFDYTV